MGRGGRERERRRGMRGALMLRMCLDKLTGTALIATG
jgi:hypothetical protein